MLDWTLIILNSASISLNVYMLFRTWWRYWKYERPKFHTKHLAPAVHIRDGVHFVPNAALRIYSDMRKNDRRYARAQLRSNCFFSLLWVGVIIFLIYNSTNI